MAHTLKSEVWRYFKILEDDNTKAMCKVCQEEGSRIVISRGGKNCKQFTTTNLRNHLRKHPKEFLALSADEKTKRTQQDMESTESTTVTMRKKLKTQMSLQQSIEAGRAWDMNSPQAQHITNLIGEMMVLDNQPFLIAEDLGFMRLIKHVAPRYQLPSRHHFSEKVIPNLVKRAEAAVAKMLEKAKHFSFTSDIWTCSHTNDAFISLTAHWIDEHEIKVPRKSIVLQSSFFPGSHTGERIAEKFKNVLLKWNIDLSRCHIIVTDNAGNISNAVELAGLMRSPCVIHTLQLAIKDAIFSQRSVNDMIARARRIVTHFHHSALGCSRLAEIQDDIGLPKKKLIQDVATRWNSTYYLLDRLLENKRAVVLYSTETPIATLSSNEWSLMEKVLRLLQPFEEYTKLMSKNNSCISEVIPAITVLTKFLSRDDRENTAGVGTMRDELSSALETRFRTAFVDKCFVLATTIDPRFKTKFCKDDGRTMLVNELDLFQGSSESDTFTESTSTEKAKRRDEPHKDLWSCFEEIVASDDNIPIGSRKLEEEVNAFLALPLQPLQSCPYTWWLSNKQVYPNIFNIALKYLSPPSSSVYSERVFSEAGNISTETRSRLAPHKADNLLFLHHNIPKLNFDY